LEGTEFIIGRDLVENRNEEGVLKLPKESGRGKEDLAEWIVNKPSRSWIVSFSKGEAENLELANIEHRC